MRRVVAFKTLRSEFSAKKAPELIDKLKGVIVTERFYSLGIKTPFRGTDTYEHQCSLHKPALSSIFTCSMHPLEADKTWGLRGISKSSESTISVVVAQLCS